MKQIFPALKAFLLLTFVTGAVYPLLVTAIGQAFFPRQANGSLLQGSDGKIQGSELIAQGFKGDKYFWPRPSAVDYNPLPSGGSNLGPTSKALQDKWQERRKAGLSGDLLAASASGLDPHISPESAYDQVPRIAQARGKSIAEVNGLIASTVERRQFGFLGENRVNVLKLNRLLDEGKP
ncbi:MAG: potassium-transporting ATPase subunit KdpC [Bacteriovoracia bacterium]